jgi:hypothetical protein
VIKWLAQILGTGLIVAVLADIYLAVLYARSGMGVVSHRLGDWLWRGFRLVCRAVPRYRDGILSLCGPTLLLLIVTVWVVVLIVGFALIVWPNLGTSVKGTRGDPTPTDFGTAIYVAGYCFTTIGNGDFVPTTTFFRVLAVTAAVIGVSVITLTLTYFIEVYNALQARNTFALSLHHATGDSGDAADLLAGLGAGNDFEDARGELAGFGTELINVYESHHFYSSLIHFRFGERFYALPRIMLLAMETITLVESALDDRRHAFLKNSAQARRMWEGGMQLLTELADVFLPIAVGEHRADQGTRDIWRRRYDEALARLRREGIEVSDESNHGFDRYVELREKWDAYIVEFARYLGYPMDEVDPAMKRADKARERHAREDVERPAA